MARTTSEIVPTAYDGLNPWYGKKYPVTLVSTVVLRNTAVIPSSLFAESRPNATMSPERIPIRLIATCTNVKVDIPEVMIYSLSFRIPGINYLRGRKSTPGHRRVQCSAQGDRVSVSRWDLKTLASVGSCLAN